MKLAFVAVTLLFSSPCCGAFFSPSASTRSAVLKGYLDDLSRELYAPDGNPDIENDSREATDLAKDKIDRMGPGDWSSYRDFGDEFDGGDGQMGVAGDGNKKLEKFGQDVQPQLAKSKVMSAKNAWGRSTGYADKLIEQGMEAVRAQQMENWMNQQELRQKKNQHIKMTEQFDQVTYEEDWRSLSKFGIERNQDFDFNQAFGQVTVGNVEGVIELSSRMGQASVHEFIVKNEYMGFADFRAAFTPETNTHDWSISPTEGSMSNKEGTTFLLRFKPNNPGFSEGHLVIETEDFKKTWKLIGSTA